MRGAALVVTVFLIASSGCGLVSSDTTVSLVLPGKAKTGAKVEAQGVSSEKQAGLEVTLTEQGKADSLATATTNKDGRYKLTFTPTGAGSQKFVVTVIDGKTKTLSAVRAVTILDTTTVWAKLVGNSEATIGAKRSITGKVEPAGEIRTVVLESSTDSKTWTQSTQSVETSAKGVFALTIDTSSTGERFLRAKVSESDSRSEATTPAETLGVYDYKAAGRHYLACVKDLNGKLFEYDKLTGFEVLKRSAGRMVKRNTDQAKCLRNYEWPPSVADSAEQIAASDDLDADVWNQMSAADTYEIYSDLSFKLSEDAGPATQLRSRLGLPNRPTQ